MENGDVKCKWMLEEGEDKMMTKNGLYQNIISLLSVIFQASNVFNFCQKILVKTRVKNIRHFIMIKFRLLFATSKKSVW